MHYLLYQAISTPEGLMFRFFGSIESRGHYLTFPSQSQWEDVLTNFCFIDNYQFYIFGDSAYVLRPRMIRPFIRALSTPEQLILNYGKLT